MSRSLPHRLRDSGPWLAIALESGCSPSQTAHERAVAPALTRATTAAQARGSGLPRIASSVSIWRSITLASRCSMAGPNAGAAVPTASSGRLRRSRRSASTSAIWAQDCDRCACRRATEPCSLRSGGPSICVLLGSGGVVCFGQDAGTCERPVRLPLESHRAVSIAGGSSHWCVLLDDGAIECWGTNQAGQLGLGDLRRRSIDRHGRRADARGPRSRTARPRGFRRFGVHLRTARPGRCQMLGMVQPDRARLAQVTRRRSG